ncbi:MAG: ATP-binding protein [Lentisphaeria bacterium]|nr:ATP-binding protein [Lentisphaeria bacterium]
MFKRKQSLLLAQRLREPRRFIQVLTGPRQTGKTVIARQVQDEWPGASLYASSDEPTLRDSAWLGQQWDLARLRLRDSPTGEALLVLDEVQKLPEWSETVKRLWDEDTASGRCLKVVLLGSSPLLLSRGLTESLAGRFEVLAITHWGLTEMHEAFGYSLEEWVFYGGYPGAAVLRNDAQRWREYIKDSLIETSVSKDILLLQRVDKPALLRRLFELGCLYSGQILSYQKMLGQLHDAGNTTTLAHYLDLLGAAGFVMGLGKYSGQKIRTRASSPKLLVLNTALMSALDGRILSELLEDRNAWGRWVESAVGAWLANSIRGTGIALNYWLDRNREVDFVLSRGDKLVAIEVKSGARRASMPGIEVFAGRFPVTRRLLVGAQGIPLEGFLAEPAEFWLE